MRLLLSVTTICGCMLYCSGQGYQPIGAQSSSLNHASIALSNAESYFNNPGSTAEIEKVSVTSGYSNPLLISSFQHQYLSVVLPSKKGVWSTGAIIQGDQNYLLYRAGIGYSMRLSEGLFFGVQANFLGLKLPEYYGHRAALSGAFGALYKLNEKIKIGFSVFNFGRAKVSEFQNDRFNSYFRIVSDV